MHCLTYKILPSLFCVVFSLLNAGVAQAKFNLPPLSNDAEKLAFLLQIRKEIPKLFADAAKYDIDLFRLLDNEAELIALLENKFEKFNELYLSKKYIKMSMQPLSDIWVGQVELDQQAVIDWKNSLIDKHKTMRTFFSDRIDFQKLGEHVLDFDPVKLLNQIGYIRTKNKKEINKFLEAHKNSYSMLAECKKQGDIAQKYFCIHENYDELNDLPELPSKMEILDIYDKILRERKAFSLLPLAVVMKYKNIANFTEIKDVLDQLKSEDLLFLKDPDAYGPLLSSFFKNQNDPRASRAFSHFRKEINLFANRTVSRNTKLSSTLELIEVQPTVGIFRGCVGGDCSSQYSFPYPNDPHERVFFIKKKDSKDHEKDTIKGYLSATEVLVNGEKALYIISINGLNISAADTELILRGLEEAKHELGVSFIVLPTKDNLANLINFTPVREIYVNHIEKNKKNTVNIVYQDQNIREQIENYAPREGKNYNEGTYDHMKKNEQGIILSLDRQHTVKTTLTSLVVDNYQEIVFNKNDIFEFLIELKMSHRKDIMEQIFKIGDVINLFQKDKIEEIRNFFSLLDAFNKGEKKISISDFEQEQRNLLVSLELEENFFKKYPTMMIPAYFLFTDAFEEPNLEKSVMMLEKRMRKSTIYFETEEIKNTLNNQSDKLIVIPWFSTLIEKNRQKLLFSAAENEEKTDALGFFIVFNNLIDEEIFENALKNLNDHESTIRHFYIQLLVKSGSQDPRVIDKLKECLESKLDSETIIGLLNIGAKDARANQVWAEYLSRQSDQFLIDNLFHFEKIPCINLPLIERLARILKNTEDRKDAWNIMYILEKIGFANPVAIEAMRGWLGDWLRGPEAYQVLKSWGCDLSWWDTIKYKTRLCSLL